MNKGNKHDHAEMMNKAKPQIEKASAHQLPFCLLTVETEDDTGCEVQCAGYHTEEHLEAFFMGLGKQLEIPDFVLESVLEIKHAIEDKRRAKQEGTIRNLADTIAKQLGGDVEVINLNDALKERVKQAEKSDDCECPACDVRRRIFGSMTKN